MRLSSGAFLTLQAAAVRPMVTMSAKSPPIARRAPHAVRFGKVEGEDRGTNPMDPPIEADDSLFWLRDDTRKDEEILGLLKEENAYTESRTAHLSTFRQSLYDEMLSHVQEDDDTHPSPAADGFEYWSRTIKGKSFRQYLRRAQAGVDAEEMTILDVNAVPSMPFFAENDKWDAAQCDVYAVEVSPAGKTLAYSVDGSGYETYVIRLKSLDTGVERDEQIEGTAGQVAWLSESVLAYVRLDAQHRPFQVWTHTVGTAQAEDVMIYEDLDNMFNVDCWTTRDGSLLMLESESKETTELHFVRTGSPGDRPTTVRARQPGVRYSADSHAPSGSLIITSNADGKVNRELLVASLDDPGDWRPLSVGGGDGAVQVLPHSASRSLDSVDVFKGFAAVSGREDGFTQVWIVPLADGTASCVAAGEAHRMAFEAESFTASLSGNRLFDPAGGALRVEYSSMTAPRSLLEYDTAAQTYQTLKVTPVPGYDASQYQTRRVEVTARDGVTVPMTLLWRRDKACPFGAEAAPSPCHLYGYGSYGICMDPSFSANRLALVDRGVVYAIAHIRGGGEMGFHSWYESSGKYLQKRNTFTDFVDCGSALVDMGVALEGRLSCEGRSAGGLLVGNVINMTPDLWCAAIAGVPFVDLMTTMCDPSIPLTTEEWEEWGNPNEERYYEYMRSYSPIDNVQEGVAYPSTLIVSGLNDPRVAYWEPAKWAQVLRSKVSNGDEMLLKVRAHGPHSLTIARRLLLHILLLGLAHSHVLPSPLYADGPGGRPLLGSAPTPLHSRATVRPLSSALLALSLTCVLPLPSLSTHRLPTATATCASWPTTLHGSWTNWARQTSKVMWIIRISRECACCDVV